MERNIKERVSQYVDENKVKEKLTQFFQEKIVNRKAMFIPITGVATFMLVGYAAADTKAPEITSDQIEVPYGEKFDVDTVDVTDNRDSIPSAEELKNGVSNLKDSEKNINYILTYEAPTIAKDILKQRTNQNIIITPLNTYLQEIMHNVDYMHWYFGSLHIDLNISKKMTAVFNEMIEI